MSRVPRGPIGAKDPQEVVEHLGRVQRVVDGAIEFGSPQDPRDPASTTLAAGNAGGHNGTLLNIAGSWVEVEVDAADARFDCAHNLGVPVTVVAAANQPNVRWLVMGLRHNGAGVNAASTLSVNYDSRDAANITLNSFPLRLYAAGARTVGGAPNTVRVSLFFTAAVR